MLRDGAEKNWIENRTNLPTAKSSAEIARDIPARIRAQAFFSARVAEAHILDRFRTISDDYNSGKIGRDEARHLMRQYAREQGKDDGTAGLKNLASTARLNLIIDQNAKMARAVGEYERMYSPANMEAFPFVIFRAGVGSKKPRPEHRQYDGRVLDKNDPWLRTHWPPLDFGCNCRLENCSAKKAGKLGGPQPLTPPDRVTVDSASGFSFDPEHAFEEADLSGLQPQSRASIIRQAEEAVKESKLGSCGMISAPPVTGLPPSPLPELPKVRAGFEGMKEAAEEELRSVGLDPANLPDYETVNRIFREAGKQGKNIPGAIIEKFPSEPFEIGKLNARAAEAAGLPELPVTLERGNPHQGVEHLWRNHKELFADPAQAEKLLRETLGNPNGRVVVSMKRATATVGTRSNLQKVPICLKRIVLHNPETQTYCVLVSDGERLKLVSWNNADDDYGKAEWMLK